LREEKKLKGGVGRVYRTGKERSEEEDFGGDIHS